MVDSNILFIHRLHPLVPSVHLRISHRIRSEVASFREFTSEIHMKAAISELSVIRHIFQFLLGSQMCCFLHQLVKKTNLSVSGRKVQTWKRKKKKSQDQFLRSLLTCQNQMISFPAVTGNHFENFTKWLFLPVLKGKKKKKGKGI